MSFSFGLFHPMNMENSNARRFAIHLCWNWPVLCFFFSSGHHVCSSGVKLRKGDTTLLSFLQTSTDILHTHKSTCARQNLSKVGILLVRPWRSLVVRRCILEWDYPKEWDPKDRKHNSSQRKKGRPLQPGICITHFPSAIYCYSKRKQRIIFLLNKQGRVCTRV